MLKVTDQTAPNQQPAIIVKLARYELRLSGKAVAALGLIVLGGILCLLVYLVIEKPESVKSSLSSPL